MTTLTVAQETALAKQHVFLAYFIRFDFASGSQYISTLNINLDWDGHTWLGFGSVGAIGDVETTEGMETSSLTFTLNAAQLEWLALAVGNVEEYRGKTARMWMVPLTESLQMIDTPVVVWSGIMDTMAIAIDGEEGALRLKCETSAYGLKRRPVYRLNDPIYRALHPNNPSLQYLNDLIANPITWLSRTFQKV